MKITVIQGAFLPVPPLRGGAVEKMWFGLGQEFVHRGHHVTHVSRLFGQLPAEEWIAGVQHLRVRGFERPGNRAIHQVCDYLYTRRALRVAPQADVLVTNTFWAPLLARDHGGKVYVDVQRMPRGQLRFYRRAARLRANSSVVADAIRFEAPAIAARVKVIPNPLPFETTQPVAFGNKSKRLLFVGRLHPEKGIELLLRAWRQCRTAGALSDWSLQIVGPHAIADGGGGNDWFERLRAKYDDVIWTPPIFDADALNRLYQSATVFVYPSVAGQGETFGLAVLEAMAWGAVPVVSDLACFRDFVERGRNGIVFDHRAPDPVGALAGALREAVAARHEPMGRAAAAVRETHSIRRIGEQFLADFATL